MTTTIQIMMTSTTSQTKTQIVKMHSEDASFGSRFYDFLCFCNN